MLVHQFDLGLYEKLPILVFVELLLLFHGVVVGIFLEFLQAGTRVLNTELFPLLAGDHEKPVDNIGVPFDAVGAVS